ncbi:MAG: uncharacterized membrane protein (DUF106 family) [Desulforhopalus sp.]|jgi:uncharacterized membrane protein (DUF106 family)
MEALLDTIWEYLAAGFIYLADVLYAGLQNLHFLGPVVLIFLLAIATIGAIKFLTKLITTKRYTELEKTFNYWSALRDEAMQFEDREKGKRMARNIDKAELNKAYYDYFFEGFMLGIARKIIPIFFMFAFINEYYRTEKLTALFSQAFVIQIPSTSGEPILVGAVFWYLISLFLGFLLWFAVAKTIRSFKPAKTEPISSLQSPIEETSC